MNTQKFTGKAVFYDISRPGYPEELKNFLVSEVFNKKGADDIVEFGAGTGIFSQVLLNLGCHVYAVEPNDHMRRQAEQKWLDNPWYHSVKGSAEHSNLPDSCADFVIAAQSFHWFETSYFKKEVRRLQKRKSPVVLLWNDPIENHPLNNARDEFFRRFYPAYCTRQAYMEDRMNKIQSFFASYDRHTFINPDKIPVDIYIRRILSMSMALKPDDSDFPAFMEALQNLVNRFAVNGYIEDIYETVVYDGFIE